MGGIDKMSEKQFRVGINKKNGVGLFNGEIRLLYIQFSNIESATSCRDALMHICNLLNTQNETIQELEKEIENLNKFESSGEHIRLSINIETGELQRHIYAKGQWFGDFDRVLCKNWISEEDYQRFIDRIIDVYNNEFKGDYK